MSRFKPRDPLDRIFEAGIILKGLDGILETIGGLLLLAVAPTTIAGSPGESGATRSPTIFRR